MVKLSYNRFHGKWEIYYHKKGKQHIAYTDSFSSAVQMQLAAQRVVDRT